MSDQGTIGWKQQRLGKVTASRIADVCARTKTGFGASRASYMSELIIERLTGTPIEGYTNAAMQWGIETEPQARRAYAFMRDVDVVECGFINHPTIECSGASPDGLVGDPGLVEIKAPTSATHIETLLGGKVPDKYVKQMLWQLDCTGREWCDFASFDPRMPEEMQLFVKRVERDEAALKEIRADVVAFLAELDAKVATLRERFQAPANVLLAG